MTSKPLAILDIKGDSDILPGEFRQYLSISKRSFQCAGSAFFEKYERRKDAAHEENSQEELSTNSRSGSGEEGTGTGTDAASKTRNTASARRKKQVGTVSCSATVRKALDENEDLYQLLGIACGASSDDIKKAYRAQALIYHPDKKNQGIERTASSPTFADISQAALVSQGPNPELMTEEEVRAYFIRIQNANEILSSDSLRKQYDSALPFDDSIPQLFECVGNYDFFELFGPVFNRNARWSTQRPVPALGDATTAMSEVTRFYKFWGRFQSWRDFSSFGEFDLAEADSRDERRWMEKENWKQIRQHVRAEEIRIQKLVSLAKSKDPRIIAEKEREEKERSQAVAEKQKIQNAAFYEKQLQEERKNREEQDAKRRQEMEIKARIAEVREEKQRMRDLRKQLRDFITVYADARTSHSRCDVPKLKLEVVNLNEYILSRSLEDLKTFSAELEVFDKATIQNNKEDRLPLPFFLIPAVREVLDSHLEIFAAEKKSAADQIAARKAAEIEAQKKAAEAAKALQPTWTDEDLSSLAKALQKYPGGTPGRWKLISQFVASGKFDADMVAAKAKQMNQARSLQTMGSALNKKAFDSYAKKNAGALGEVEAAPDVRDVADLPEAKQPDQAVEIKDVWTAEQQKAFENMLQSHPAKNFSNAKDRWTKIASGVQGKTAAECLTRFKACRESVRNPPK